MGNMHDVEPFLGAAFSFGNKTPHTVSKDFSSRTRQRIQPGIFQRLDNVGMCGFFKFGDMSNFRRAQSVKLKVGIKVFQLPE